MKIEMITASSLEKIFPLDDINFILNEGSMLKNERYSFQVAIKSDTLVTDAKLIVKNKYKKYCRIRRVDLSPAYLTEKGSSDYVIHKSATLYPDILIDDKCDCVNLRPNMWAVFWINVENLPIGEHKIDFFFNYKNENISTVNYKIKVINKELSNDTIKYSNWMHYDCIANYYNIKVFSKKFYKILGKYLDNCIQHGINILYTPLFTPPLDTEIGGQRRTVQLVDVEKKGNGYFIKLDRLKEFILFAQSHGFEMFEFSHLFSQWGATSAPKILDINGKQLFGWDTKSDSKEYFDFLNDFLPVLNDFIKENGLYGKCFYHLSDEPSVEHINLYSKLGNFVRGKLKNAKLIDALSNFDFYKQNLVDIPVVATSEARDFGAHINKCWVYYCCVQWRNNLSNRFFNFPPERNRVLGIQLYLSNVEGFLHWGYNFYNSYLSKYAIDPYRITDGDGLFQAGDAFIVYPAENGVYDSTRHEVFYDGLQDYRVLKTLENLKGKDFVVNLLNEYGYMADFTNYPHDPKILVELREKVNKYIENISII